MAYTAVIQCLTGHRHILSAVMLLPLLLGGASALAQDDWTGASEKENTAMAAHPEPATVPGAAKASGSNENGDVVDASGGLFHTQHTLASGAVVVVEESRDEPRSIGSYTIRLYSGAAPRFPLDDFRHGLVLARDGYIEQVHFLSPNMLIIVLRSAGSGGYLSGTLVRAGQKLEILGTLQGLPPDAALVEQLRALAADYPEAD